MKQYSKPKLKALKVGDKKSVSQTVRIPTEEFDIIRENANKYAGGNISAWLRYTGKNYKPKAKEIQS